VPDDNIALQQGQSAKLLLNGKQIGSVGKLHPTLGKRFSIKRDVYLFKLEIVKAFPSILLNVKPISKYPLIRRDISVIVEKDIKASDIIKSIKLIEPEIIQSVKVFDIFEGNNIEEGLKSIALGLILQEKSRTLTDQVADDIISKVIISLGKKFSAKLRE
jgi:phenylalanyl-tRNA synthetase beta chain